MKFGQMSLHAFWLADYEQTVAVCEVSAKGQCTELHKIAGRIRSLQCDEDMVQTHNDLGFNRGMIETSSDLGL